MVQWVEWITRTSQEDEAPNIDWLIAVFLVNKKDNGNLYPSINSWEQPMGALKDLLKIYIQPKRDISVLSLTSAKRTERIF